MFFFNGVIIVNINKTAKKTGKCNEFTTASRVEYAHYDYNIICEASDYWVTWLWHIKGSYGILIRLTD